MEVKNKYFFITPTFEQEIRKVVQSEFPSLNDAELYQLGTYLSDIIEFISIRFNFVNIKQKEENASFNREIYEYQLKQNNYRDIKGLLNMLLPFINDTDDKKDIRTLNQLYIDKRDNSVSDINKGTPLYKFTNIQYGRCKRYNSGLKSEEIPFNVKHLNDNFLLLKETISIVSHKLYINWIDIQPIANNIDTIKELQIFDITNKQFKAHNISINYDIVNNDTYNGLYIGDIYNTLANYLYDDIIEIKWLIYDMNLGNGEILSFIIVLSRLIPLENTINNISYHQQSDEEKIQFDSQWKELLSIIDNNKDINGISNRNLKILIKVITAFFDSKYSLSNEILKNGYKKLTLKEELDPEEEDEVQLSRTMKYDKKVFVTSKTITSEMIYNYLFYVLSKFKKTWYSSHFIKKENDKVILLSEEEFYQHITCKNVYNYAKSLSTYTKENKLYKYPRYWHCLNIEDKKEIHRRINSPNISTAETWWNIRGYLKYAGLPYSRFGIIYLALQTKLIEMIFSCLTFNGILSQFIPQKYLTDESLFSQDYTTKQKEKKERMKEYIFNEEYKSFWDNSNYFITNAPYKECLMNYEVDKKQKTDNYLKVMEEGSIDSGDWYNFYALNWVAQIAFFHHYLNNSVMYVTGGTGVGKSTQVPKLLLYAMKMIDYKQDGKIVCTVPRRPVAVDNANTISTQMGLPIAEYNESLKGYITTNNYYIQYQHQKSKHTKPSSGLTLNIVTDGLLLQQMLSNPLFKTKTYSESIKEYEYSKYNKNKYDIVIVDEAHEHNKNMDYILSLMKYALYYNNSLKLVIISATMDDDEPTYRRFYRDINDNRMYPLNQYIMENKIDRVNVDRRIHISPPGILTRHTITEKERKEEDADNIVLEITKTTSSGDILLFRPGKREIAESISNLNQPGALPPNCIAIPFHGEMSEEKRELISKLASSKGKLTYPRDVPYDQEVDEKLIKRVPEGTYNRVVIVATDIAEASLTINTLRYVVETGIRKSAIYDYKTRDNVMKTTGISEASRLQRKGRVGRVAPGTVYYTYDIKSTQGEKKPFSIAISDISEDLFGFLRDSTDEKPMIIADPHKLLKLEDLVTNYPNGLHNMIKEQYFYKDTYFTYYGVDDYYDYENNKPPYIRYQTGYSKETLEDKDALFYIIHPDELYINRNINGVVVSLTPDASGVDLDDNKIKSYKILSFWDSLIEKICLISVTSDSEITLDSSNNDITKTQFGKKILAIKSKMPDTPINDIISYIYGRQYGVGSDILKILAAKSDPINGLLSSLCYFDESIKKMKFDNLRALFSNCKSDSYGFVKILDQVHSYFVNIGVVKKDVTINLITDDRITQYQTLKNSYLLAKKTGDYTGLNKNTVETMLSLDHNNKISYNNKFSNDEKTEFLKEDVNIDMDKNELLKKEEIIYGWCKENGYNYDNLTKFFMQYIKLTNDFIKYDEQIYEIDKDEKSEDVKLDWFDQRIQVNIKSDRADNITCSLLHGYGFNIVRRVEGSSLFVHISNPTPDNVSVIGRIPTLPTTLNTLIKPECIGNYLMYLGKKENDISFIHNVTPELIQSVVAFIYMPEKFSADRYNINMHYDMIKYLTDQFKLNKEGNTEVRQTVVKDYTTTIRKIKTDMVNTFDRTPYYNILKFARLENKNYDKFIELIIQNQYSIKRNQTGGKITENLNRMENRIYATYILNKILK